MFNNFPSISKEEWLAKIQKEYRGNQSLESLYRNNGDLIWHPFHNPSDNAVEFKVQTFPHTFSTGIVYNNEMPDEQLISNLEAGVSFIYFDSKCIWNAALGEKIRWDYIQSVVIENQPFVVNINEACDKRGLTINKNVLKSTSDKILVVKIDDYQSGKSKIEGLKKSIDGKKSIDLVIFELGDAFLFNIGFMRGIVKFFTENSENTRIMARCAEDDPSDIASTIAETAQIIATRLAGVPNILLSNSSSDSIAYYKAMIPNILDYESELLFEQDPVSGSQYLDYISAQVFNLLK